MLERSGAFIKRHPIAATTVGGTALLAMPRAEAESERLSNELRSNLMGSPHGRYVYAELEDFEARKQFADEKLAFVKSAYTPGGGAPAGKPVFMGPSQHAGKGFFEGVGKETASAGIGAIAKLIKGTVAALQNKFRFNKEREELLDTIVDNDPIVSVFEEQSPGSTAKAYETMKRFAPNLSLDPNVATSFLREAAQTGGTLNYQTVKHLADAEAAVYGALNPR
jgi:hypothetical protein